MRVVTLCHGVRTRSVKTTDIMREAWKADVWVLRPDAIVAEEGNRKKQNFDYAKYSYDDELQKAQFVLIIDELINRLPRK